MKNLRMRAFDGDQYVNTFDVSSTGTVLPRSGSTVTKQQEPLLFTGFDDADGKPVFENDIIAMTDENGVYLTAVIVFEPGAFFAQLGGNPDRYSYLTQLADDEQKLEADRACLRTWRVIGSIDKTPDLLVAPKGLELEETPEEMSEEESRSMVTLLAENLGLRRPK